jgi:hypothetical protein
MRKEDFHMGLVGGVTPPSVNLSIPLQSSVESLGPTADLAELEQLFSGLIPQSSPNVGGAPFANSLSNGFMSVPPTSFGYTGGAASGNIQGLQLLADLFGGGSSGLGTSVQSAYGSPPFGGSSFNSYAPSPGGGRAMRNPASTSSTSSSGNPLNVLDPGNACQGMFGLQNSASNKNNIFNFNSGSSASV